MLNQNPQSIDITTFVMVQDLLKKLNHVEPKLNRN